MKKLFWLAVVLILFPGPGLRMHGSTDRTSIVSPAAGPSHDGWTQLGAPTAPGGTVIDLAAVPSDPQAL